MAAIGAIPVFLLKIMNLWKGSGRISWGGHWQGKRSRSILGKRECVSIVEKFVLVQRIRCHLAVTPCKPQDSSSVSRTLLFSTTNGCENQLT